MRSPLALLLIALPFAIAEPKFVSPVAGSTISAGTITVTWKDGGNAPSISDLNSYQLLLFTGSNTRPFQLADLKAGSFSESNSISATISSSVGGSFPKNAYFLGMIAASGSGAVTVFSDRFSINGMTGIFPPAIETDLASISGIKGPQPVNVQADERQEVSAGQEASFAIPYGQQTGLTKYAPMQKVPVTKITATNTAPLYPSSSVVLASMYLPNPSVLTTLTKPQTFVAASHPNTAPPVSHPTDAMQRFLNRWKD